jgi:HlyD family secretion protein
MNKDNDMKTERLLFGCALVMLASCGKNDAEYDASGVFEATEVTVSAKSAGELTSFSIVEGADVATNTVVGTIDAVQLKLKKQQLQTQNDQLRATQRQLAATRNATDSRQLDLDRQVASIRQQIANAKREKQRFTELLNDGAATRKQVDDISYQISVLEKQLTATEEQIRSNNSSLAGQSEGLQAQTQGIEAQQAGISVQQAQLDDQIENTLVKSPVTGAVIEKYVEAGEYVTVGKPLFKVADTRTMYLRAYVTSAQLQKVKVGQRVKVMSDYGGGKHQDYDGVVTWIASHAEFTPKTILTDDERADQVYAVKIAVKNDGYIKIGMYGEVKF